MGQPVIQTSFNAGEWAPTLYARVDLAKYHSGAALLRNFTVDYRGGATTRPGTRYVATSQNNAAGPPRLVRFQASFTVSYIVEFGVFNGAGYARFYTNGAQVLLGGVPYTIASPYTSAELPQIKFTQNVNQLIINHPNHPAYILTLISATNWTLVPAVFGSTLAAPTGLSPTTNLAGGTVAYAYVITAVDVNGQESAPSAFAVFGPFFADIRNTLGTNTITWTPVTGAQSYNVYRANPRYGTNVPAGSDFGFVGNVTSAIFYDSDITPDFSQGPPIPQNPFAGSGVQSVNITGTGSFGGGSAVPAISFTGGGGSGATAIATLSAIAVGLNSGGNNYAVGDIVSIHGNTGGLTLQVTSVNTLSLLQITGFIVINSGIVTSGNVPTNPVAGTNPRSGVEATFFVTWGVSSIGLTSPGSGYATPPTVGISGGAGASATAVLGAPSSGNPTVPGFIDQRFVEAAPVLNPQQLNLSQPGSYFNFNTTSPVQPDNAIQGTLIAGELSTIEWLITQPQGLIILADNKAWLLNGGSPSAAVSATEFVARPQSYNGAASVCPPIVANDNILYVQSKGSIVRDLVFNFYTNVFTGTDITVLSSHLFYGFQLLEWAWAEEPFKIVWAVRNDGALLSLTFLKEQELIAWSHSDTQGAFKSVASITESTSTIGNVNAVYTCVQRNINGASVYYIERFVELVWPQDYKSSWQVDAGINYTGAPATIFSSAQHLAGAAVTGVADGAVINFTMPVSGTFQFGVGGTPGLTGIPNASIVTVGLSFLPQLQTLPLDLGEPTIQGKRKKIAGVTLRVANALGLSMGRSAATALPLQDLIIGNVGSMTNQQVTGLVSGDARGYMDPLWDVPGQYFIQQTNPYPASILGVIPEIVMGDTEK
jgi:hypothetical protein